MSEDIGHDELSRQLSGETGRESPALDMYMAILKGLQQAVIITDPTGVVTYWSEAAADLYGWAPFEAVGAPVMDLTPADFSRGEAKEIMSRLGSGQIWSGSIDVRTRSGSVFRASVTDVPLRGPDGRLAWILGVSSKEDRTSDLVATLEELRQACEQVCPGRVIVRAGVVEGEVKTSRPHLLQLLALAVGEFLHSYDGTIQVSVGDPSGSPFAEFDMEPEIDRLYVRVGRPGSARGHGLVRGPIPATSLGGQIATLARMIEGTVFVGEREGRETELHLLLPSIAHKSVA